MAHVVRMLWAARCVSSVAFSEMHVACRLLFVAHFSSGCLRHCCPSDLVCVPFLRRMSHVLRWLFSGARPSVPCRMACAVCRMPHVASRLLHVLRCESSVVCCMLHVPSRMLSLVCCLSHFACRHTVTMATRTHARTHTSVCSRSRRPLRRSIASAAAGVRAPEARRRKARRTSHVFDHKERGDLSRH